MAASDRRMSGTLVLGIGNRLSGDDAAGPYVVDMLNRKGQKGTRPTPPEIIAIDAGTSPESYTSLIRRHQPDLLILVDAADMGLSPGSLRIIPPVAITVASFSTHHMPLSMLMSYTGGLCPQVVLIGLQPEQTDLGRGISKAVRSSVKKLTQVILEGRTNEIPLLEQGR